MAITTIQINTCDLCQKEITTGKSGTGYINAMVYGATFHHECLTSDMLLIIQKLGLDDILLVNNRGDREKLIHSRLYN